MSAVDDHQEAIGGLEEAASRLRQFTRGPGPTRSDLDDVLALIARAQIQLFGPRPRARHGEGARTRILRYLQDHAGEIVTGEEIARVSGIQEWARRVRELRVEHGYEISELGGSRYRLEDDEPNIDRARQWKLANGIRNEKGSARHRIGLFLEATVGEIVTRDQIDYVGGIKEGVRRVRELRDEYGWPINSHIDEPGLSPGAYRLISADPADRRDPRQRLYPEGLREAVFARDDYSCQKCGRNREKALAAGDTRFYLEIHHKHAVSGELEALPPDELNALDNLLTLCHHDHVLETAAFQERRRRERAKG